MRNDIEEAEKEMAVYEESSAETEQITPEEESLLERSSAPTIRDLRDAAEDLLAAVAADVKLTEQATPGA